MSWPYDFLIGLAIHAAIFAPILVWAWRKERRATPPAGGRDG